jgi:hypothetical protein
MALLEQYTLSLLLLFALTQVAYTSPVINTVPAVQYPEVIPGPGLPSLASLNLTSAQLYEMPFPTAPTDGMYSITISLLLFLNVDALLV